MTKTFKEIDKEATIDKKVVKAGLSLAIIFSKEEIKRFKIQYGDTIRLDNAQIVNNN